MWIVEHLFLDSLLFLKLLPTASVRVLDLGSGAGFPGIPMKIVRADLEMTLLESRRRRASFLSATVRGLRLDGIHVVTTRAEDQQAELEGRFDAVVMRCAGNIDDLMPLASKLAVPGGVVIASGPPDPRPLAMGEWQTVPGVAAGSRRRFAVYRRS
jgi:16S rRNA (guanine527-N7)-methyltransferase